MELQHNLLRKQCGPSWGLVHILQPVQQKTIPDSVAKNVEHIVVRPRDFADMAVPDQIRGRT